MASPTDYNDYIEVDGVQLRRRPPLDSNSDRRIKVEISIPANLVKQCELYEFSVQKIFDRYCLTLLRRIVNAEAKIIDDANKQFMNIRKIYNL